MQDLNKHFLKEIHLLFPQILYLNMSSITLFI